MLQVPVDGHAHIFGSSAEGGLEAESMKKGQEEQEPGAKMMKTCKSTCKSTSKGRVVLVKGLWAIDAL